MNENRVREIVRDELTGYNFLLNHTPELNTKKACEMIGCGRDWLYRNKHLFGGKRVNKRGDLKFNTLKIIEFKKGQ